MDNYFFHHKEYNHDINCSPSGGSFCAVFCLLLSEASEVLLRYKIAKDYD